MAIITGGAAGIGAALTRAMSERGDIVVIADMDAPAAEALAEQLASSGHRAHARRVDVRDAEQMKQLVEWTRTEFGRIDYLINNAGVVVEGEFDQLTAEQWNLAIDVNLRGVINGISAVYPVMLTQGDGHIVNMASLAGLVPAPMATPYGATKHAVVGLSTALRSEASACGVRVSVVCPGAVNKQPQENRDEPLGKLFYAVDLLARDILRGVDANRGFIVAPRSARILWRIQRAAPWLGDRIAARFAARVHRGAPPLRLVRGLTRLRQSRGEKGAA